MDDERQKAKKRALLSAVIIFMIVSLIGIFRFYYIVEPGMEWLYFLMIAIALILAVIFYSSDLRKIRIREENQLRTREEIYERERGVWKKFVMLVIIVFIITYFIIFTYFTMDLEWILLISLPGIFVVLVMILNWKHNINKILYDDIFFEIYYRRRRKP